MSRELVSSSEFRMASSPSNTTSEPSVIEQVINEFFAKSVHIILESRSPYDSSQNYNADPFISSPSSSSSLNFRARGKWFDLALRDCPAALESFDVWRQSNHEPLVVDVVLNRRKTVRDASCASHCGVFVRNLSSGHDEFGSHSRSEKIVERWIMQYESQSISQPGRDSSYKGRKKGSRTACQASELKFMYKKAYRRIIVLLRSLYAAVRLLPVYKLFRHLNASGKIHPFCLSHNISSFAEPFSREEDAKMSQHDFGTLDILFGRLSLSVAYLKTLDDVSLGPSIPISIEFIMDYVGSPLADPLKRLPSLPTAGSAPSYASFSRRHSWRNDHGDTPCFSSTPSPTYSDSRDLDHNFNHSVPSRYHLPENYASPCSISQVSSATHTKNNNECRASLPISPSSSSPSNSTHLYRLFLCLESAQVSNPSPRQKESDGGQNQGLYATPYSKRQGCPQLHSLGTQVSTTSTQTCSPENKLQLKKESLRLIEFQTGMVLPKIVSFGKDSAGHLTGLKTPCTLPQIPFRSSRRLSFMDGSDDSDFTCPFAEDDVVTNSCRVVESANCKDHSSENMCHGELMPIRRSSDAAVGELVWMLRRAPALRLVNSNTFRSMQAFKDKVSSQKTQQKRMESNTEEDLEKVDSTLCLDVTAPDLFKSRTAADAFKELRTYKDIRELILRRGGSQVQDVEHTAKSNSEETSEIE